MKTLLIALGLIFAGCEDSSLNNSSREDSQNAEVDRAESTEDESNLTLFEDRSALEVSVEHQMRGNKLVVTATVTNRSSEVITFVDHPDFWHLAVYAANRDKDDAINSGEFAHYHRATEEDLKIIESEKSTVLERSFILRHLPSGVVEIEEYPQFSATKSFMRVSDDSLRATFHYGRYPKRLPENAEEISKNYIMVEIRVGKTFPVPEVTRATTEPQR